MKMVDFVENKYIKGYVDLCVESEKIGEWHQSERDGLYEHHLRLGEQDNAIDVYFNTATKIASGRVNVIVEKMIELKAKYTAEGEPDYSVRWSFKNGVDVNVTDKGWLYASRLSAAERTCSINAYAEHFDGSDFKAVREMAELMADVAKVVDESFTAASSDAA